MPINAGYEYFNAEKAYEQAQGIENKIAALEEMIRVAPKHKGAENLLAELKTRLKKLREKQEKGRSVGKTSKKTIRKEGYQVALIGLTGVGKSALLAALTNARPLVSDTPFTTFDSEIGTMDYDGVKAQIVDMPAVGHKEFDNGLANTADCLLLVVEKIEDIEGLEKILPRALGRKIVVFNKMDLLSSEELRKLDARCKAKRLNYVIVSAFSRKGIDDLKQKIFSGMNSIRIYTKEPGKEASKIPVVLKEGSTVRDVAEKILKGFSARVKETKVTGPSAKFANQKVGLSHQLKDKDVVEFKT